MLFTAVPAEAAVCLALVVANSAPGCAALFAFGAADATVSTTPVEV
jgi:hypothetical protein